MGREKLIRGGRKLYKTKIEDCARKR